MSEAVMISIRPKWCEKIASGEKTIEVRKTRPKLQTPFKCYIYCTIDNEAHNPKNRFWKKDGTGFEWLLNGDVIGEFVCYRITNLFANSRFWLGDDDILHTCLSPDEIRKYANGANRLYGWHISDLKIYDRPKALEAFTGLRDTKFGAAPYEIKRAPQSWCYVEEQE